MTRWLWAFILAISLVGAAKAQPTALPGLIHTPMTVAIALPDGRPVNLEALTIRPDRPGRFPLVILVHGTPRPSTGTIPDIYRRLSPAGLASPALMFARHGYAAVSILRRGFGRSDGPYAEGHTNPCDNTDYLRLALISAEDVTGAVVALQRESWVDPRRIVLLGLSTGGLAVIAVAAANPPGVVGVIDFAGARGSYKPDNVCSPHRLAEAFTRFGQTARIPALWVFAENDHYFNPVLARRLFDAYTGGGAPAKFQLMPPFGEDGHSLLSRGPPDLWWPPVEAFLATLHLPTAVTVKLPPPVPLAAPQVNDACLGYFREYVEARTDAKAFAINPEGHCGFKINARTADEARDEAMRLCSGRGRDCALYASGQAVVPKHDASPRTAPSR
jgi:dienelactone hydrolase